MTDVADTEQLLRLIQSIPSPKAEPFKQWLAKVGYERMQEIADPEQSLERARENWQKSVSQKSLLYGGVEREDLIVNGELLMVNEEELFVSG